MPPGYVYQSPYLAAAAPGGLMQLPSAQLSHAAAVAAASQFYNSVEFQNAAAAAASYPGASYNYAEAYPYATAAGMCYKSVTNKGGNDNVVQIPHHLAQQTNGCAVLLAHKCLEKDFLPPFMPSVLRGNGSNFLQKKERKKGVDHL